MHFFADCCATNFCVPYKWEKFFNKLLKEGSAPRRQLYFVKREHVYLLRIKAGVLFYYWIKSYNRHSVSILYCQLTLDFIAQKVD
jgi:hypothetical protein